MEMDLRGFWIKSKSGFASLNELKQTGNERW
jgi:hypothetical protein